MKCTSLTPTRECDFKYGEGWFWWDEMLQLNVESDSLWKMRLNDGDMEYMGDRWRKYSELSWVKKGDIERAYIGWMMEKEMLGE